MGQATKKRIEELEARIRQLEARPPVYVPYPVYTQPWYVPTFVPAPLPHYPYQEPYWNTYGISGVGVGTIGNGNAMNNALTYGPEN